MRTTRITGLFYFCTYRTLQGAIYEENPAKGWISNGSDSV
jgi:hypothetical protein